MPVHIYRMSLDVPRHDLSWLTAACERELEREMRLLSLKNTKADRKSKMIFSAANYFRILANLYTLRNVHPVDVSGVTDFAEVLKRYARAYKQMKGKNLTEDEAFAIGNLIQDVEPSGFTVPMKDKVA